MKKFALIHIIALLFATAFADLDISLQEEGRYFLPTKGRLQPDLISIADSIACLSYNSVPAHRWAVVDFELGVVFLHETINGVEVYAPRAVSIDSFLSAMEWERWQIEIKEALGKESQKKTKLEIDMGNLPPGVRGLIGTGGAGLAINGSYRISLSGRSEWSDNEAFMGSKWPQLQMEQDSRFTITGNIGSKIKVKVDQDSQRETDLENTINISYTGEEDDVVQSIEAGNTTLSLPGASLIGYSERVQGLFGIKSVFQVGDWNITAIASQEKANTQQVSFPLNASKNVIRKYDYQYKERTYYYISDDYASFSYDTLDSISFFELYSTGGSGATPIFGWALVNPGSNIDDAPDVPPAVADSGEGGYFVEIDPSYYYVDRKHGWFRLNTPAGSSDILGVKYIISHSDGTADTVGFDRPDTIYLKMIKPSSLTDDEHPCWEYEWRNVYSLDKRDIQLDETFIHLFHRLGSDSTEVTPDNANVYMLTWYGMDSTDLNNSIVPNGDGIVDQSPYFIDASRGELIFTVPHPFDPQDIDIAISPALADYPDSFRNPAIYTTTEQSELERYSNMFIIAETKGFSTIIDLGAYNIIPGSEIIKLNGEKLIKDKDYSILYEIGQLRLLSDRARDPNARIEVTFESQPFFSMQQKTLIGSRIQYELGEDSWFGITGLYKSVTTPERRPRVGGEPSQAFMYDVDLRLSHELPFLTSAIDALPLLQTDAPSNVVLSLETAQILSNPNTIGEAYLDDFEGSKSTDPISITRTMWTPSSAPFQYDDQPRAKVIWYNPYNKVPVRDIWPDREVSSQESSTDVLTIEYFDTTTAPGDSMPWAGIMQYINPAYQNQQNVQFLEIWVQGDEGILSIDLGRISEDIDGDGYLDTEDKLIGGRRDGILTEDEDTGLDTLFDEDEPGYDGTNDPNGDNWSYPSEDDYSHINGTEGNRFDPAGLKKPDTEDLNGNGVLDQYNEYFEFRIDLSDTIFQVPGTRSPEGWRLYRIPLQDSVYSEVEDGRLWHRIEVGNPDHQFNEIYYARLWLTGIEDGYAKVQIAKISLVHNQWKEDYDHFEIAVKNSQEHQDYVPCPDADIEIDPTTGLTLAEQSLVLKYKYLPPLDTVYAIKTFSGEREEDYTHYAKLTMWVYYDSVNSDGAAPILFFRMGDNQGNLYEYRTKPLHNGWDERNKVEIIFDDITFFKEQYQLALNDTTGTIAFPDSEAANGNGYYRIYGSPNLTKISQFELGLINPDPNFEISGEVWCDELMVKDVRKDDGRAYKGAISITAADFATFNIDITQKDDDFHGLTSTTRYGRTGYGYSHYSATTTKAFTLTQNYTGNFRLGKFCPIRWGVNLPLSLSYSQTLSIPRFKTNSDIAVPDSLREQEKTLTKSKKVSMMGIGVSPQEPTLAQQILVVPNRLSYTYQNTQSTSPTYPEDLSTSYTIIHTYNFSPSLDNARLTVRPAKTDSTGAGIGGEISIAYIPSSIAFNTTVVETKTNKLTSYGTRTEQFTRTLNHDTKLQYKPVENVTAQFSIRLERDIHMSDWFRFGPPTIFGKGKRKVLSDGVNWNPKFVKFLTQKYSVMSNYDENTSNPTAGTFGTATQRRTFKADLTLNWNKLLGKTSAGRRRRGGRGTSEAETDEEEKSAWQTAKSIMQRMDNVKLTFNWDGKTSLPNLQHRPTKFFQFGFTDDPGVQRTVSTTTQNESQTFTKNLSISTGIKLPQDISVSTRYKYTSNITLSASSNTKNTAQTFPDLSARWGFVKNVKFFKKFANSTTANSNWSHQISKNYTENELKQQTTEDNFSPLLGMNFSMKGGWTLDLKFNWKFSVQETYNPSQISYLGTDQKGFVAVARYSLRAQKGIKIPLLGTLTLENNLNLTLTLQYSNDKSYTWTKSDPRKQATQDRSVLTIKPKATYNLSRNATAGIEIEIKEDTDNRYDITTHVRDVKIWIQFQFGGGRSFRR